VSGPVILHRVLLSDLCRSGYDLATLPKLGMSITIDHVEVLERRSINVGRMRGVARPALPSPASSREDAPA